MSRYTGKEQAHQILEAASEWRQRCLINGGSLFSNKNLWDSQHLAEIERDDLVTGASGSYCVVRAFTSTTSGFTASVTLTVWV